MLPLLWPLPLRHSHSCLYTRSVFERQKLNCDTVVIHACTRGCLLRKVFEFLRPFVRGTPTTHSEGLLLLRLGALPCAPTYNRGVVQHVIFNRLGLAQPHECSSKAAIYHANSSATSSNNNLYRGRNCCTTHDSKATYKYFLGQDFLTGWGYQKIVLENVLLEKAFSDSIRSGFLVPYQKSRFLIIFSNSIISGLTGTPKQRQKYMIKLYAT